MAYITESEIKPFVDLGLVNPQSFREMATMSREMCLKRGETGYSAEQMRNFAINGHTCSPQVREMILDFFETKGQELAKKVSKWVEK